jgi:hypothetical protein
VKDAIRSGVLSAGSVHERVDEARDRGVLSADEARQLHELDAAVLAITGVDDFDPAELRRVTPAVTVPFHDTAGVVG